MSMQKLLAKLWRRFCPSVPVCKTIWGVEMFMDLRDSLHYLALPAARIEAGEPWRFPATPGLVWDVGCNVGIYAVAAALCGNRVKAFDISPKACWLLRQTAEMHELPIQVVNRAMAVYDWLVQFPCSAHVENRAWPGRAGQGMRQATAITYVKACYDEIPALIKMDIEGAEAVFLNSVNFKSWIIEHRITLAVETHGTEHSVWPEMRQQCPNHWIYDPAIPA